MRGSLTATEFQSTLSVRRATGGLAVLLHTQRISIHALREESDTGLKGRIVHLYQFQSTLSVRRATLSGGIKSEVFEFQSTLSVRRATVQCSCLNGTSIISIHALREESDITHIPRDVTQFISIHALREESDQYQQQSADWTYQFQSTLSVRRAT